MGAQGAYAPFMVGLRPGQRTARSARRPTPAPTMERKGCAWTARARTSPWRATRTSASRLPGPWAASGRLRRPSAFLIANRLLEGGFVWVRRALASRERPFLAWAAAPQTPASVPATTCACPRYILEPLVALHGDRMVALKVSPSLSGRGLRRAGADRGARRRARGLPRPGGHPRHPRCDSDDETFSATIQHPYSSTKGLIIYITVY